MNANTINKALDSANNYFLAGQFNEALREYSNILLYDPLSKEAYNCAILCDMAIGGEAGAQALFDYYAILKDEDKEQADTIISEILETMDGTLEHLAALFSENAAQQRIEYIDGILYGEFKELVIEENDFKRIFENIMFSTKVIITEKEDFVDFLDNLITNGYSEMAMSYLEGALGVYPNDAQLRNLLRRLAKGDHS
jgi:tetratricopeptide (TPR) repeat protein